jgi:conjugal transfer pilus assembly protein TraD
MSQQRARRGGSVFGTVAVIWLIALVASAPAWATWAAFAVAVGLGSARLGVRVREGARERKTRRQPPPEGSLPLGETVSGEPVWLTHCQLAAHGLLVGASGSGKSTSLLKLLCEAIVRGVPVVSIDLKGSKSFYDTLRAACQVTGRPLGLWRVEGAQWWNPLQYGDATELKDKLISAERFTEPHYQRAAERYLQTAIQVLQQARPDKPVTLAAVTNVMDPDRLRQLLPHVPKEFALRVGDYLNSVNRDQRSAVLGLQSRLALLAESKAGEFLQPGAPEHTIDLYRALCGGGEAVLFSLNSSRNPKLCAQIAAMVIQDLVAIAGYRQNMPNQPLALIAIDEFGSLDHDNVLAIVAKAREAVISVLLSTQELADLDRLAEGFKDQVLGNTAVLLAHRQNVPDSAELIARMIGTQTVWQRTYQTREARGLERMLRGRLFETGMGTQREVEEFVVHPNTIKQLPTGRAVLITKIPYSSHQIVDVHAWKPPNVNDDAS